MIAHIVMRQLGDAFLADPEIDIDAELPRVESTAGSYVTWLEVVFPENAYPGNLFKNQTRCLNLLKDVESFLGHRPSPP